MSSGVDSYAVEGVAGIDDVGRRWLTASAPIFDGIDRLTVDPIAWVARGAGCEIREGDTIRVTIEVLNRAANREETP